MSMTVFQKISELLLKKDTIPHGFQTANQWAKEWNVSEVHARRVIKALKEKHPSLVDNQKYKISTIDGRTLSTTHYNIKIKIK